MRSGREAEEDDTEVKVCHAARVGLRRDAVHGAAGVISNHVRPLRTFSRAKEVAPCVPGCRAFWSSFWARTCTCPDVQSHVPRAPRDVYAYRDVALARQNCRLLGGVCVMPPPELPRSSERSDHSGSERVPECVLNKFTDYRPFTLYAQTSSRSVYILICLTLSFFSLLECFGQKSKVCGKHLGASLRASGCSRARQKNSCVQPSVTGCSQCPTLIPCVI